MPIQVNEATINELATLTGIEASKLKAELIVDAATAPTETKIKDLLTDVVIMKKSDHATLIDNTGKSKFDEGKYRAHIDLTKAVLGEKAFDVTKEMTREQIAEKAIGILKTDWQKEAGKEPSVKEKELTEGMEKLRKLVGEKEAEANNYKVELEKTKTFSTVKESVVSAVSGINFAATGEKLSKQRDVVIKNILSSYEHKNEDGQIVWYKDGKKLVDNLQSPKKIEDIAKEEAVIFDLKTQTPNGRGDESSKSKQKQSGELDAELVKAESFIELNKILSSRGLSAVDAEGKAVIKRWNELHKKTA